MIRKALEKDIVGIHRLLGQVLLVHHNIRPDIFKKEGAKYTNNQLKDIINNPQTPIFVYVDDNDNVLGHLFFQVINNKETSNTHGYTTLYIDDICIDKNSRHKSIGTALFNFAKEYAKTIGAYNITLHVWTGNNDAEAFYKKMGMTSQYTSMEMIMSPATFQQRFS